MAIDATGTPTSLGIPKFDVDVDAPSGLGGNAQMDAIDALIVNRVLKPAGLTTGDVPVWNGSTFVRPTGTASSSVFLRGDGAWATPPGGLTVIDDLTVTGSVLSGYDTATRLGGALPTGYKHIKLICSAWSDGGSATTNRLFLNNQGSGYYWQQRTSNGASTSSGDQGASADGKIYAGSIGRSSLHASQTEITFADYNSSSSYPKALGSFAYIDAGGANGLAVGDFFGIWGGASAALTRIALIPLSGNFQLGSRFTLYGVN